MTKKSLSPAKSHRTQVNMKSVAPVEATPVRNVRRFRASLCHRRRSPAKATRFIGRLTTARAKAADHYAPGSRRPRLSFPASEAKVSNMPKQLLRRACRRCCRPAQEQQRDRDPERIRRSSPYVGARAPYARRTHSHQTREVVAARRAASRLALRRRRGFRRAVPAPPNVRRCRRRLRPPHAAPRLSGRSRGRLRLRRAYGGRLRRPPSARGASRGAPHVDARAGQGAAGISRERGTSISMPRASTSLSSVTAPATRSP